jgi:hypothetical protein
LGVLAATLLALPARGAGEDPGWQQQHMDAATGTVVSMREHADGWPEFRAVTTMSARLSALVSVVLDSAHMHEWVYRTRSARVLELDGPTRGVSIVVSALPWPLWDREAVVAWQLTQDPQTGTVVLAGESAGDRLPPPTDRVRMPSFQSRWQFVPQGGGQVEVWFEGHADLGGNLSLAPLRAFVAAAAWQAPLETINGLRQQVQRPEYRAAVLPYIREPAP